LTSFKSQGRNSSKYYPLARRSPIGSKRDAFGGEINAFFKKSAGQCRILSLLRNFFVDIIHNMFSTWFIVAKNTTHFYPPEADRSG
jgi:hypothetical protein